MREMKGEVVEASDSNRVYQGYPHYVYEVTAPAFSDEQRQLAKLLSSVILHQKSLRELSTSPLVPSDFISRFDERILHPVDQGDYLRLLPPVNVLETLVSELTQALGANARMFSAAIARHAIFSSVGYGELSEPILNPSLEEIMVNGFDVPVFVFHRRYGMCKTNISFAPRGPLFDLINHIGRTVGKDFGPDSPLLDARLPDGSRANATFGEVSPRGPSLTIRKFSAKPISVVDLMVSGTLTAEAAAFLWMCVEGLSVRPANLIVSGGTGTGKTTLLNVLAAFIPGDARIVTIEDTRELDLGGRLNWVPLETRPAIGATAGTDMDALLKNALRMRPDRIIVGEVRGPEAQTLFAAMDTGHQGILGTVHANSARELLLRLKFAPMNVPENSLPLLNLAVITARFFNKREGMKRKVLQIAEITRMEDKPLLSNLYECPNLFGVLSRSNVASHLIEEMATSASMSLNEFRAEMATRQHILEWLKAHEVHGAEDVHSVIQHYYLDPQNVLDAIEDKAPMPKKEPR